MKKVNTEAVPKIGDYVEIEGDYGCASNTSWMQKVVNVENDLYFFNEGSEKSPYLVGYKINFSNFVGLGKNRYDNNQTVYIYSH